MCDFSLISMEAANGPVWWFHAAVFHLKLCQIAYHVLGKLLVALLSYPHPHPPNCHHIHHLPSPKADTRPRPPLPQLRGTSPARPWPWRPWPPSAPAPRRLRAGRGAARGNRARRGGAPQGREGRGGRWGSGPWRRNAMRCFFFLVEMGIIWICWVYGVGQRDFNNWSVHSKNGTCCVCFKTGFPQAEDDSRSMLK